MKPKKPIGAPPKENRDDVRNMRLSLAASPNEIAKIDRARGRLKRATWCMEVIMAEVERRLTEDVSPNT